MASLYQSQCTYLDSMGMIHRGLVQTSICAPSSLSKHPVAFLSMLPRCRTKVLLLETTKFLMYTWCYTPHRMFLMQLDVVENLSTRSLHSHMPWQKFWPIHMHHNGSLPYLCFCMGSWYRHCNKIYIQKLTSQWCHNYVNFHKYRNTLNQYTRYQWYYTNP